jgi:hypothetical protein
MKVTLELWHVISLALGLAGAFTGLGKLLLLQFQRQMDERFGTLSEESKGWRETDRSILELRAELAERYVRREDYIRGQTVIEAKLDAISSELKNVQIQGARRET